MRHEESDQQRSFVAWTRHALVLKQYPELALLYCQHNTQRLTAMQAGRWKALGGCAGIPDLFLAVSRVNSRQQVYCGLYIEFKRPDLKPKTTRGQGGLSKEQQIFKKLVEAQNYYYAVCYDWLSAKDVVTCYLQLSALPAKLPLFAVEPRVSDAAI